MTRMWLMVLTLHTDVLHIGFNMMEVKRNERHHRYEYRQ